MNHNLKCFKKHFVPIWNGDKTAEVRLDDRDYKVGDVLTLHETTACYYTGRYVTVRVLHILDNFVGLSEGYVMLSFYRIDSGRDARGRRRI